MFRVPEYEIPQINSDVFSVDIRDPDEVTKQILGFLTTQAENARKQFKTSRNLIIVTIVIMILQIIIAGVSIALSISEQNNLTKLIDMQSQQSEVISRMSLNLLDLQVQVQTLEQENEQLNQSLNRN